jgi:TolB-like protein/tetratricopeptide (TPR) repeat protein
MLHQNPALLAEEVNRICASPVFRRAKTQTKLLRYLAGEAVAGRGNELNQYLIATEGMGLAESFDPTTDATVRVWGVRLRRMLANYYRGPGRKSAERVRFPERSFCPHLEIRGAAAPDSCEADKLPTVAVMEFRGIGLRGSWRHYPAVLAENLMAALTAMQSVEAVGPMRRPRSTADPAFAGHHANFTLDGSVEAVPGGLRLRARLLRRSTGGACWAETFETKICGDRIPRADLPAAARLAAVLGDDFGVIRREVLLASLGKPVESLSSLETIMLVWRSWSSMGPRHIAEARRAMRCAVERPRASPLIKAFASLNLFDSWATAKRLRPPLPAGLVRLAEDARRTDPSNAWILLANLYASIAAGDTRQAERWVRQIDERRATTPALRIIFAYARLAYGLGDADAALRVWRKAMRETPSPMASSFVGPAIHALRKRRWKEALALLDQTETCDLPLFPALHAAALAGCGKKAAARRELAELRKIFPDFSTLGADMLARNTDPSCCRIIHRTLAPLAPELFPAPTPARKKHRQKAAPLTPTTRGKLR